MHIEWSFFVNKKTYWNILPEWFNLHPAPFSPAKIYLPLREVNFFGAVEPWVYVYC